MKKAYILGAFVGIIAGVAFIAMANFSNVGILAFASTETDTQAVSTAAASESVAPSPSESVTASPSSTPSETPSPTPSETQSPSPSPTETQIMEAVAAVAAASATPVCSPTDPASMSRDLTGTIPRVPNSNTTNSGTVTNTSATCSYQVILASYKKFDHILENQELFDYQIKTVAPGETANFLINTPDCEYQIDLFAGHMVYDFKPKPGYSYGERPDFQIDSFGGWFQNLCKNVPTAKLTLVKTVDNTAGGTKTVADFPLFQNNVSVTSGTAKTYSFSNTNDSVLVTATETNQAGYTAGAWGGDCAANGTITLRPGENKTCTIKNTYVPPTQYTGTLKLVKTVINDNGGTKTASDFPLFQNAVSVTNDVAKTYSFSSPTDSLLIVATETNQAGYTAGTWGGDCATDGKVTLHPGENKVCTITNNDTPTVVVPPATLKIIKTVINDNGGVKTASDFALYQNNTQVANDVAKTYTFASLTGSTTVIVSEGLLTGYTAGVWGGDCASTLAGDANKDGHVNQADMDIVSAAYGTNTGDAKFDARADFNNDGAVNFFDLTFIAQHFGTSLSTSTLLADKGDANNDGQINQADMDILQATYGKNQGDVGYDTRADFNNDNSVNFFDLVVLAQNFGSTLPISSVILRPGENKVCTITNDDIPPATLTGACFASKNPLNLNESVTWSATASGGTGTYTYAWSGDNNLGGTASATTTSYSTAGTKNAQVVITSGTQSITKTCTTVVNPPSESSFSLTCSASPSSALTNNEITFTANPTGGTGTYTYSWTGDDSLSGTTAIVKKSYIARGQKNATVTVVSGNETKTATCSVLINEPTTGCTGTCGGGGGGSSVTLTKDQNGKVAGVFLSQVPYTGIGSNLKIALFMLAILSWSGYIAYVVLKRKLAKENPALVAESVGIMDSMSSYAPKTDNHVKTMVMSTLEAKAREYEAIVSTGALEKIADAAGYSVDAATVMLRHAIEICKAQQENAGQWVAINSNKIESILNK